MKSNKFTRIIRNILITVGALSSASLICYLLMNIVQTDTHVPQIFILAILITAAMTDGYIYGAISSVISMILANFAFTTPYFEINFSFAGYPLTFITFLAVSLFVSWLMATKKKKDRIELEAEREKLRSDLLSSVSHDFRTPLTSIIGYASALTEDIALTDETKSALALEIKDDAEWLLKVLENIISLTRLSGGDAKINKQSEAVEEIIGDALIKIRKKYPAVTFTSDIPDEIMMVPMDGLLIEQVLVNLADNSVSHGNKTSRVSFKVKERDGSACFSVEDDGDGIDEKLLPNLFEGSPLNSHGSDRSVKSNLGIGLSLCNSIVKAHGGTMKAENLPGGGARVMFTLPMK